MSGQVSPSQFWSYLDNARTQQNAPVADMSSTTSIMVFMLMMVIMAQFVRAPKN